MNVPIRVYGRRSLSALPSLGRNERSWRSVTTSKARSGVSSSSCPDAALENIYLSCGCKQCFFKLERSLSEMCIRKAAVSSLHPQSWANKKYSDKVIQYSIDEAWAVFDGFENLYGRGQMVNFAYDPKNQSH